MNSVNKDIKNFIELLKLEVLSLIVLINAEEKWCVEIRMIGETSHKVTVIKSRRWSFQLSNLYSINWMRMPLLPE